MFKIEITDDTADALFRDILVQDYQRMRSEVAELEMIADRKPWQDEDLEHTRRYRDAMEVLLDYYLVHEDAVGVREGHDA
jgi:hypothetical protein